MNGASTNGSAPTPRMEVVTTTFVATGVPAGMRDLARLLENLNNPAISRQVELRDATVRPLYRAASPLMLEAPVLVRRDDIIFATFEGLASVDEAPDTRALVEVPCLLMAPPFQIQGSIALPGTEAQEALRSLTTGFMAIAAARVYDADGYLLGEGERIIVNGARVQMCSLTKRHIEAFAERAGTERRAAPAFAHDAAAQDIPAEQEMPAARAA